MKTKKDLIWAIMEVAKSAAIVANKTFDEGIFFTLAFRSEDELREIAKQIGIK